MYLMMREDLKEEKISEFNDRTNYISIEPDKDLPIKGKYMIEIFIMRIDSSFIEELVKELNEAKKILGNL